MKLVKVTIKGISPLLIHAFGKDFGEEKKVEKKKKGDDFGTPREQAEKHIYARKNGNLWIPTTWIMGSIAHGSSEYKLPGSRKSLKSVIGGTVFPSGEIMEFSPAIHKSKMEIDSRPVCIQRASSRVMRHRGRVENWKLVFELQIDDSIIDTKTIHELLNDCGKRVGIGDFRPQRNGPFGRFQVSSWKVSDEK